MDKSVRLNLQKPSSAVVEEPNTRRREFANSECNHILRTLVLRARGERRHDLKLRVLLPQLLPEETVMGHLPTGALRELEPESRLHDGRIVEAREFLLGNEALVAAHGRR